MSTVALRSDDLFILLVCIICIAIIMVIFLIVQLPGL